MNNLNKYYYSIKIDRIIDGDTVDAIFDLGFNLELKVRIRCMGYDSPESWRPSSPKELEYAIRVTEYFKKLLETHQDNLTCLSTNIDLYGRSSGIIFFTTEDKTQVSINDLVLKYMIDNNLTKEQSRLP